MNKNNLNCNNIFKTEILNHLNKNIDNNLDLEKHSNILNSIFSFIDCFFDFQKRKNIIISISNLFDLKKINKSYTGIINLKKINDVKGINDLLIEINKKLPKSGMFLGCAETFPDRRKAIFKKYPVVLNWFVYFLDFIFTRILPKLYLTKYLYFLVTNGRNQVLSRAEIFGRLYYCGFEIIGERSINNILYFAAKKNKDITLDNKKSYGFFIKLRRIGKHKKYFNVYKLRTMHPYAEYLQQYVYDQNKLAKGGKIQNDFRISPEGRVFRKFWLDELPMIINLLKGEMKLIGVRPLSEHYFNLYTNELQNERVKFKPGLLPPFYADLPETLDDIIQSEMKYLNLYKISPIKTDLIYFYRSFKNIFINGARSK